MLKLSVDTVLSEKYKERPKYQNNRRRAVYIQYNIYEKRCLFTSVTSINASNL